MTTGDDEYRTLFGVHRGRCQNSSPSGVCITRTHPQRKQILKYEYVSDAEQ